MQTAFATPPAVIRAPGAYAVRLVADDRGIQACQALRYKVFNLELEEGLDASHATGLDAGSFVSVCDHLLVEHRPTGECVGTYRLQTGRSAAVQRGYYSEQEFDFRPFEPVRAELLELGRACVHRDHRKLSVLGLLWRGIAAYARRHGARYLCGCSSITSQDPAVGASAYADLCRGHLAPPEFRTAPLPAFECPLDQLASEPAAIPKLLRTYLSLGAKICGPPRAGPGLQDH